MLRYSDVLIADQSPCRVIRRDIAIMETFTLDGTDLVISRTGFGALPIQKVDFDEAEKILRQAYESGITFFDTARGYTDSEDKIGRSLARVRDEIVIATKAHAQDKTSLFDCLHTSLEKLKTNYVDILQLHNPSPLPDPEDKNSAYAGLVEARQKGLVRFIGITNHKLDLALEAAASGLYDTVQFPLSCISSQRDLTLIDLCKQNNVGLIAMKALSGGLITNVKAAFAFLRQFDSVVPIWGIQRLNELEEIVGYENQPSMLDTALQAAIEEDREELAGDFCRGCGYCLPCPADIPVPMAARMAMLLKRAPTKNLLSRSAQEGMARIENCAQCYQCRSRCPYQLDVPVLLKKMYEDYKSYLS